MKPRWRSRVCHRRKRKRLEARVREGRGWRKRLGRDRRERGRRIRKGRGGRGAKVVTGPRG